MAQSQNADARAEAVAQARRFQQEQLENTLGRAAACGLRTSDVAYYLGWPIDSTTYWIDRALDAGEITVAPDETDTADPHYVTIANLDASREAIVGWRFTRVCNCWNRTPTVPSCRSDNTHLDDCPAKNSGVKVGASLLVVKSIPEVTGQEPYTVGFAFACRRGRTR